MKYLKLGIFVISLLSGISKVNANIIYESANLGVDVGGSITVGEDQFIGSRFNLSEAYLVTGFGGHLRSFASFGALWGAIVALPDSSPSALPSFDLLEIETHALAFGLFDTGGVAQDIRVNTDLLLNAGNYALIFGGSRPGTVGLFGSTNDGGLIGNDTESSISSGQTVTSGASFFSTTLDFDGWRDDPNGSISEIAPRFVIEGNAVTVSEPSIFWLACFGLIGLVVSRKKV